MSRAPYFYVRDDERVVLHVGASPAYAIALAFAPMIVLSVLAIAAWIGNSFQPSVEPWAIPSVWGGALALVALVAWRRAATTEYALTDQRIYARRGRLVTRLHFTTHDKVTDMHYRQGPLERALGLASITFATAGGEVHVAGVRDALALKGAAEGARDAFIRTLLATSGVPTPDAHPLARNEAPEGGILAGAPAPGVPTPDAHPWTGALPSYLQPGDAPVWSARPRPIAALGSLRSLLGLIPVLLFSPMMQGPRRLYVPLGALALVLLFVAMRFLQLRRAEYIATTRRVYARRGLVGTTVNQLTYDKITDITFHQDLIGRLLGYGSVTLQTAGGSQAPITMVGLADPLAAKETVELWRDAAVGGAR